MSDYIVKIIPVDPFYKMEATKIEQIVLPALSADVNLILAGGERKWMNPMEKAALKI